MREKNKLRIINFVVCLSILLLLAPANVLAATNINVEGLVSNEAIIELYDIVDLEKDSVNTYEDEYDNFDELEEAYIELIKYADSIYGEINLSLDEFLLSYDDTLYTNITSYVDYYKNNLEDYKYNSHNYVLETPLITTYSSSSSSSSWYYNTGSSLPQKPKYTKYGLTDKLKTGDIVYEAAGGFGITGHIAVVEGKYYNSTYSTYYIRLIEAISIGVCRGILDDQRMNEKQATIYRVSEATSAQRSSASYFMETQLGKPWGLNANKGYNSDRKAWYCSELAWAAYKRQGIDIDKDGGISVWPSDIAGSSETSQIVKYTVK